MPRIVRDANLETRTARARLKARKKEYIRLIEPGLHLAYRKVKNGPGTWAVRRYLGAQRYSLENLRTRDGTIILADDYADADGIAVLNFSQAQAKAAALGQTAVVANADKLVSVSEAVQRYETNLKARNADPSNAGRVRLHLPKRLGDLVVAKLAVRDFADWIDSLGRAGLSASAINRINNAFKAALNLAADEDERIIGRPWERAIKLLPDATEARNIILPDKLVRAIVAACYRESPELGIFAEVAAVTGARPIQLARLVVDDVIADRHSPRLMMPSSKKGRGKKRMERRPVPVSLDLAHRLLVQAKGRVAHEPLLRKPGGERWKKSDHNRPFARAVKAYDPTLIDEGVTIYALRHSAIASELMQGLPIRIVAGTKDTSVAMLEKHYARFITDHSDALHRTMLRDMAPEEDGSLPGNVVAIR